MRTADRPDTPSLLKRFGFYAIIGPWMEGDVIADTVANAFTQGADRVFVVDNDSPDDTVTRAVRAGAEHVLTYSTPNFDEQYRYNLMNEFVRYRSECSGLDHVWWLWIDADEFPRPEQGGTIREMISSLDRRYRIVGGRFVDHYPTPGRTPFVPGDHPIDHQPLADERPAEMCSQRHRKHPLQRWDRGGPRLDADLGFHRAICSQRPLLEPPESVVIDHFPFRSEPITRRRLGALWGVDMETARATRGHFTSLHMEARVNSLAAVYAGDWAQVRDFGRDRPEVGVHPVDWRELRPSISNDIRRWSSNIDPRS